MYYVYTWQDGDWNLVLATQDAELARVVERIQGGAMMGW